MSKMDEEIEYFDWEGLERSIMEENYRKTYNTKTKLIIRNIKFNWSLDDNYPSTIQNIKNRIWKLKHFKYQDRLPFENYKRIPKWVRKFIKSKQIRIHKMEKELRKND